MECRCRQLEITLVSAENLPDVRAMGVMKVYAEVSLNGESKTTKKSHVDYMGKTNPLWNFTVDYTVLESTDRQPGVDVVVKLLCKRTLGDRLVGEVKIPVKKLFDIQNYPVEGTPEGTLKLMYSFSERIIVRPPSGFVLVGGTMLLLDEDSDHGGSGGDDDDDDDDGNPSEGYRDVCVEELDGDFYYDAH